MDYLEVFRLYDEAAPIKYETKDTSRGENDYRVHVFAEWQNRKIVIKITDNDFTTVERVEHWAETIEAYLSAGYYCPRIIKNIYGDHAANISLNGRSFCVYAEEFSKYKTAETFPKSEITANGSYIFLDDVLKSIGVIGAKHLNTADFPTGGCCILEKFAPSDPCDEIMQESLNFKKTVEKSLPKHKERFDKIWRMFLENRNKLEKIYPFLPTSVFQGDLNYTNILLDDHRNFVGMLDFNLCGRDTIVNHLFTEIMIECDCCGYDVFYSKEANEKTINLFLSKIRLIADIYEFSEAEINAALLVYRYLKPFWWRPAHEIENVKEDEQKVLKIFEWVENELTRTDIDFSGAMRKNEYCGTVRT